MTTFAILVGHELFIACAERDERRVWSAQLIVGVAIAYLAYFHVIRFGHGWSMYLVLSSGLLLWGVSRIAERRTSTAVLVRPFQTTALWLPAATVGLAIGFITAAPIARWLGLDDPWLVRAGFVGLWAQMNYQQMKEKLLDEVKRTFKP